MGNRFIVLIVIVLVVIAVAQLMRVYELSSKIRGKKEEDISLRTNNINASLWLVFLVVFFGQFLYCLWMYGNGLLPEAASEHGQEVDWLYGVNWIIVFAVFFVTNFVLFVFAYKYSWHPDRKAYFFPHDNRLEMVWTIVPAAALAVIIILGLMTWNNITGEPSEDAVVVEIYAKQFDFTARYSGDDNKLGFSDYKLINSTNPLGVITQANMDSSIVGYEKDIKQFQKQLDDEASNNIAMKKADVNRLENKIGKIGRIKERVEQMKTMYGDSVDTWAQDDYTAKELVLVKDQEYYFVFRSQDVIHSAYFPHFRAQMNCVPGQRTTLKFKPIFTTEEMREKTGNENFNYILLCNKICGESHSNMNMPVRVVSKEEFDLWSADENATTKVVAAN